MEEPWSVLPQSFTSRIEEVFQSKSVDVFHSFCAEKDIGFRVNTLFSDTEATVKALQYQGLTVRRVGWYADGFSIPYEQKQLLMDSDVYQKGHIYVQNLSSMIPALILNPKTDELILDIAAAPGSKTSQLSALMQNTGQIIANDISRERRYKLEANLKQLGVTNVTTLTSEGMAIWKKYPEYFDKVLVDAPCSMEGMFSCADPKSYNHWSPKKVKNLSKLQKYLLRSAISATKVGGTIVYSTCTISPEENEGVLNWVKEKIGNAVSIEPLSIKIESSLHGLPTWENKTFNSQVINSMRIMPSKIMEGFFVALLKKHSPTV